MPRSYLGRRLGQILGGIGSEPGPHRERSGRFLRVEPLESRALLANIYPTGVISSTPDGSDFQYTIALTNSSASDDSIGTFWFASVPGQDYLATNPISVTPPAGWTDQVTNEGSADGYGIEFSSENVAYDVPVGGTINFSFVSADSPAAVEGNSFFYTSTAVGSSIVYPGAAYSDGGHPFVVTAAQTLDSIVVTPVDPNVPDGETEQFTATGTYSNSSTENLTSQVAWSSTAPSMATISNASGSQGLATTLGQGPTTIVATLDGITASTVLTVTPPVLESLALTPANPFVVIGHAEQLTATGTFSDNSTENLTSQVSWSSGATWVATISNGSGSQGLATGVKKGTDTLGAALNGITGKTMLTVTPVLDSIKVTPADPDLPAGESEGFTATGTFADNSTENLTNEVTWASTNTPIATISNTAGSAGSASARAIGSSSISATFDGVTGSTSLTVDPAALLSISVSAASANVNAGSTDQLTASGLYSDGSTQNLTSAVTWSSSAPSAATVSSTGVASGIAAGTPTITASYQGMSGSTPLAVSPALVRLTGVDPIVGKHNKVTKVVLTFSGTLDGGLAQERELYRFIIAGKKGLFQSKNATVIRVANAQYTAANPYEVILTPMTPFKLSKPVELKINGLPPSGLTDSLGRYIDGGDDGQEGGDATAVFG